MYVLPATPATLQPHLDISQVIIMGGPGAGHIDKGAEPTAAPAEEGRWERASSVWAI
jgi:hypothetical protein